MKKLMITAAIVCAAVVSQAAQFDWEIGMGGEVEHPAGGYAEGMNAYIFAASTTGAGATVLQKTLVDAFAADTLDLTSGSLGFKVMQDGGYVELDEEFSFGATGDDTQFYFALTSKDAEGNDLLYISTERPGHGYEPPKADTMTFDEATASALPVRDAAGSYQGAGWYTAVPEPTSGLLLLLGVAGLALRRRRA